MSALRDPGDHRYRWIVLTNTTLGIFMATINGSIILISLPAVFRGVGINPLSSSNVGYLLWLLQGYLLVTAVLVVSLGRLGDIMGRVRIYNLGFAVFTGAAILLSLDPLRGGDGAMWLVVWRVVQGVGGAMLFANSSAIIVDAFPEDRRGFAVGINQVAAIGGSFVGLILGGLLSIVDWRIIFWVSVPFGLLGTVWAYISLHDNGVRTPARIDWWGNATFAVGLTSILVGIVYGIQPYGTSSMGWTSPLVVSTMAIGVAFLVGFLWIEMHVAEPMFNLRLFRIRAFAAGSAAGFLAAVARGGLQFMLIIWLQGIWLLLHGYAFVVTPLWSGIYLLPLTAGFLVAGPLSGYLSDRYGAKYFASGGLLLAAASFGGLLLIPADFNYLAFAALIFLSGAGMGLFSAPNAAAVMNSVPAKQRGAAAGMLATFTNSGFVLSIGIFFSLMIAGLASTLPSALHRGLTSQGVPAPVAHQIAQLPPVGSLFAAFLGYNPVKELLTPTGVLSHLPAHNVSVLTGRTFFAQLISQPFHHGLVIVFTMAMTVLVIAAIGALRHSGQDAVAERAAVAAGDPGHVAEPATVGAGEPAIAGEPVEALET